MDEVQRLLLQERKNDKICLHQCTTGVRGMEAPWGDLILQTPGLFGGDGLRFFVNADKIYCIRYENAGGGVTTIPVIFI